MQLTTEQKAEIIKLITVKLEKSFEVNSLSTTGIEPWKMTSFILDKFNKGNYYGTINVKITGSSMYNPKEVDVTHKIELMYNI